MAYEHCDMRLAQLRLVGRFSPDEIDEAVIELWEKEYIDTCDASLWDATKREFEAAPGHDACVRIVR